MNNPIAEPIDLLLSLLPKIIKNPEVYTDKNLLFWQSETLTQAIVCEGMKWYVAQERLLFLGGQLDNIISEREIA